MASAIENTSRPQCCSCDIGVRKKPSDERGPNAIIAMRQPQITTTIGVRQPMAAGPAGACCIDIRISGSECAGTI